MDYVNILPDNKYLYNTAPPYVNAIIKDENFECCMIAAVSDKKLMGYGVFSHPRGRSKDIWLEYLYTPEDLREKGVASGILEYAATYMKKKGVINILCRMYLKYAEAKESASFFIRRGYIPLSLSGRLLAYSYEDMTGSGFFDRIEEKREKLPKTFKPGEINEKKLNALSADAGNTGFSFDVKDLDSVYSRFLMNDKEINGALIARKLSDDMLYIRCPFIRENSGLIRLYPVLLSDIISDAKKDFKDNFYVLINLDDERSYFGMMQEFNPPEKEYLVQDFMNCLILEKKRNEK